MTRRRWHGTCMCCGLKCDSVEGWTSAGFCPTCVKALPHIMEDADRDSRELNRWV